MFKNITSNTILQAVNVGIPFIIIPWYVGKLGVAGYGKIGVALAVMQLLLLVVDYGFTLTAARRVAQSKNKLKTGSHLFSDLTTIKLFVCIIGITIITLIVNIIGISEEQANLIFVGYVLVLGQLLTPTWLFLGLHKSIQLLVLTILPKIVMLPMIYYIVDSESDLLLAMIIQVFPYICTGILSVWFVIKEGVIEFEKPNLLTMGHEIIYGWPLFKSSAAISVSTSITPIVLNISAGPLALGIYLIAEKIRQGMQSIITPISMVVYPKVSEDFAVSEKSAFNTIKTIGTYMMCGVVTMAIMAAIYSFEILNFIFGGSSADASDPLRILMMVVIITFCNVILSTYVLIPLGREKIYSRLAIYSAMVQILLIWPLVSRYSYVGASVSILISEFILFGLMAGYLLSNGSDFTKCNLRESILYKILNSKPGL